MWIGRRRQKPGSGSRFFLRCAPRVADRLLRWHFGMGTAGTRVWVHSLSECVGCGPCEVLVRLCDELIEQGDRFRPGTFRGTGVERRLRVVFHSELGELRRLFAEKVGDKCEAEIDAGGHTTPENLFRSTQTRSVDTSTPSCASWARVDQ